MSTITHPGIDALFAGADEYVEGSDLVVAFREEQSGFDSAGTTPSILSFIGASSAPCGASIASIGTSIIGTISSGC